MRRPPARQADIPVVRRPPARQADIPVVRRPPARMLLQAAVALVAAALAVWLAVRMSAGSTGDYRVAGDIGADNAGPPIAALIHGHLGRLPAVQTVMGLTSVLWRLPFVAVAAALGAGGRLEYVVGAWACLVPVAGLVAWVACREPTLRQVGLAGVAALVMVLGPATALSVSQGHPEEVLTVVLATAALLMAEADRRIWAAVLLGLAVGAKEWALLTAPVVLIALPGGRRRATAIAVGVAGLMVAILPALDFSAFRHADSSIGPIRLVGPMTLWWPITVLAHRLPPGLDRVQEAAVAFGAWCGGAWLAARRLRRAGAAVGPVDPIALLALLGLLRCICDPADLGYYLVAATVPLAVWEVGRLRRLPLASLLAWGIQALCFTGTMPFGVSASELPRLAAFSVFLAFSLLLAVHLIAGIVRPSAADGGATGSARSTATHAPLVVADPPNLSVTR